MLRKTNVLRVRECYAGCSYGIGGCEIRVERELVEQHYYFT